MERVGASIEANVVTMGIKDSVKGHEDKGLRPNNDVVFVLEFTFYPPPRLTYPRHELTLVSNSPRLVTYTLPGSLPPPLPNTHLDQPSLRSTYDHETITTHNHKHNTSFTNTNGTNDHKERSPKSPSQRTYSRTPATTAQYEKDHARPLKKETTFYQIFLDSFVTTLPLSITPIYNHHPIHHIPSSLPLKRE